MITWGDDVEVHALRFGGDDNFKGHAVGWTSRKAAWLVIAADQKVARG